MALLASVREGNKVEDGALSIFTAIRARWIISFEVKIAPASMKTMEDLSGADFLTLVEQHGAKKSPYL